jgi:predicted Kef-type K+ transport protein
VLDLGFVYLVIMSLAIGLLFHWNGAMKDAPVNREISWVGVMVLMFAAILPSSTPKLLTASAIAVAMNPISMLDARSRGVWEFGSAWNAVLMHYPDVLLVGVAIVISRVVTQLGRQVSRAREMGS